MNIRPRAVDWALLGLITVEFLSGLISFTVGRPEGQWLFVAHGIVGLSIIFLLVFKFRRVHRRLTEPRRWQPATIVSALLALTAIASLATGIIWTAFQWPLGYPNGMILHTTFGILLLLLALWHMVLRYKPLKRRDVTDRRSVLTGLAVLAGGGLAWLSQDGITKTASLPGASRRFTGSRHTGDGQGNGSFPVTMWMFDRPTPLDLERYRLTITGLVGQRSQYDLVQLGVLPATTLVATIDCTGGWYSTQEWRGIRVGDLLDRSGLDPAARHVRFVSSTGYRWSLPLAEAQDALLATHVGDEMLSHGHGAPLRLVAPGRRGFQWVKWVVALDVTEHADLGQWQAIFTSGLDRAHVR